MITKEELFKKYPQIFNPKPYSLGYSIPETWLLIVDQMCQEMMNYYSQNPDIPIQRCIQAKEKFGSLRFYLEAETKELGRIIRKAEKLTTKVCQNCGSIEDVKPTGNWISYLCKNCRNEKQP